MLTHEWSGPTEGESYCLGCGVARAQMRQGQECPSPRAAEPEVAFSYDGSAYVRPVGRGVLLLDMPNRDTDFVLAAPVYVEDVVPDGYYRLRITFERFSPDEERAAREEPS